MSPAPRMREDDDEIDNCASSSRSKDFIDVLGY